MTNEHNDSTPCYIQGRTSRSGVSLLRVGTRAYLSRGSTQASLRIRMKQPPRNKRPSLFVSNAGDKENTVYTLTSGLCTTAAAKSHCSFLRLEPELNHGKQWPKGVRAKSRCRLGMLKVNKSK
jgi:hypothetical protein